MIEPVLDTIEQDKGWLVIRSVTVFPVENLIVALVLICLPPSTDPVVLVSSLDYALRLCDCINVLADSSARSCCRVHSAVQPVFHGRLLQSCLCCILEFPKSHFEELGSWLHVLASEAVDIGVQVTIVDREAWVVNSVCLHLQPIDTSEFVMGAIGRKEVAPSRVDAVVVSDDRMGAIAVNMQCDVIDVHIETNRNSDAFERGDVRHNGICSEQTVGRNRNVRQVNVDSLE